jgi:hypothetical protein
MITREQFSKIEAKQGLKTPDGQTYKYSPSGDTDGSHHHFKLGEQEVVLYWIPNWQNSGSKIVSNDSPPIILDPEKLELVTVNEEQTASK